MFALVDVNNLYVSSERVFDPRLDGKPVVVLSSNDGACIARSNEAKDMGIQMAQPWFQVRHMVKTHGLIALSANFELYADMSSRMMAIAARYTPIAIPYSIDEAFLDFHGVPGDLTRTGCHLRATVLQELGLPTSVGLANTKTLAKLANHIAKVCDRKPQSYPEPLRRLAKVCNFGEVNQAELRSWTSGENLTDFFMAPSSQTLEPPQNPGRFSTNVLIYGGMYSKSRPGISGVRTPLIPPPGPRTNCQSI